MLVLISHWLGSLEYREISPFPNTIVAVLFCLPCLSLRILFMGWNSMLYLPYMPYNFLVIPINLLYNQCFLDMIAIFLWHCFSFLTNIFCLLLLPLIPLYCSYILHAGLISYVHSLIYLHSNLINYVCILISFSQMRKRGYNEVK